MSGTKKDQETAASSGKKVLEWVSNTDFIGDGDGRRTRGTVSAKEPYWIEVNYHALPYFVSVPALVVCDNCRQAVIANKDWIALDLNIDCAEWAEYNHTVILPAKVKKPKYKSSDQNAVGILAEGFFHDMEEMDLFQLGAVHPGPLAAVGNRTSGRSAPQNGR